MSELREVNTMEQMRQDILELKQNDKNQEQRISILERTSDRHDQQIKIFNEKLAKIDENTTWIKRTITGAIISTISTVVVGGILTIVWNLIKNQ
jgi:hypothetical protein